jgi:hypothetical protein
VRYSELIETPEQLDLFPDSNADFARIILKDCAPFVADLGGDLMKHKLWRGIEGAPEFGTRKVRKDGRIPMSTSRSDHHVINDWFTVNFGLPWRNGAFTTGEYQLARAYGKLNLIFPKGEYKILWNPAVIDLYNVMSASGKVLEDNEIIDQLDQLKPGFRTDGIQEAIQSGREIMLWCDEYYHMEEDVYRKLLSGMEQL